MARIVGYARVSGPGPSLDAQVEALKAAGAESVFREKESGAKTDRAQLAKAIAALEPDDTLLVCRLDRFARSTRDLLNMIAEVTEKGAKFKSLADAWEDTTTPHGELMVTILGGLATFERALIKARTDEGRRRAIDRGVKMGRKFKLTPHQRAEIAKRREDGESIMDLARSYGVSHPRLYWHCSAPRRRHEPDDPEGAIEAGRVPHERLAGAERGGVSPAQPPSAVPSHPSSPRLKADAIGLVRPR